MEVNNFDKKNVYKGFFKLDEVTFQHELFDGTMSPKMTREVFDRGDSVAAFIYNKTTKKVILIKQFRYPVYDNWDDGWILEIVAGMIDDLSPEETIIKEVLEEIGYLCERVDHISTFFVSPGASTEKIYLFYIEVSEEGKVWDGGGLLTENEDIQLMEYTRGELLALLSNKQIIDAKTMVATIMWFTVQGAIELPLSHPN